MFSRPEVVRTLDNFVCVRLYTDGAEDSNAQQQRLEQERFGTVALPLYAIVRADGSAVSTFPGLTRDVAEFTAFLAKGNIRQ